MAIEEVATVLKAMMDITNVQQNSKNYNSILSGMYTVTKSFADSVSKGMTNAGASMGGLDSALKRIRDVTFSILVADTFRDIEKAIVGVANEAVAAVSVFQTMKIQFDTLAARDYARQFGVPIATALRETAGQAQDLLYWVRQLAVTTPFSVEDVGHVLALAQAYGFTVPESKKLTESVGNFTAAMGLGDEVLRRIIYNMGQMVAQGKPTGRELRDLSNSFVPIGTIADRFGKQMGVARAEILKMFSTGKISAKAFVAEFVKMVDEDFPNAMTRMSRTFLAVQNNIKDLIQSLLGYEVLGPIADRIAGTMQDMLQSVLTPENYAIAGNLGQTLLFGFDKLAATVQSVVVPAFGEFFAMIGIGRPTTYDVSKVVLTLAANIKLLAENASAGLSGVTQFIGDVLGFFGTSFTDLTTNMFTWGENIILAFADGMANALIFVVDALTSVADTITYWLQAGSPPKILPELTLWGTQAMASYMEGWKVQDFSVFTDISDMMSKAIKSWGSILTDVEISGRIIKTEKLIAQAVDQFSHFGNITVEAINGIMNAAGFASQEMSNFILATVQYTKAANILEAVNSMLKFSGSGSVNVFGKGISSFGDIKNIASMFGGLSNLISNYASDSLRLAAVDKKLAAAQAELNRTMSMYDAILGLLNGQLTKLKDQQVDMTRVQDIDNALATKILTEKEKERLINERAQIMVERQIRDKELEKEAALDMIKAKIEGYQEEQKALKERVELEKQQIKEIAQANADAAKAQAEALKQTLQAQIDMNNELKRQKDLADKAKADAEKEAKKAAGANEDLTASALGFEDYGVKAGKSIVTGITQGIKDKTGEIQKAMQDLWDNVLDKAKEFWGQLGDKFSPLKGLWDNLVNSFKNLTPKLQYSWDLLKDTIGKGMLQLRKFWEEDGSRIAKSVGAVIGTIVENLFLTKPGDKSVIQLLAEGFVTFGETLSKNKDGIVSVIDSITNFFSEDFFPMIKGVITNVTEKLIPAIMDLVIKAIPPLMDFLGYIVKNAPTIIGVILAIGGLQSLFGAAGKLFGDMLKTAGLIMIVVKAFEIIGKSTIFVSIMNFLSGFVGIDFTALILSMNPWVLLIAGAAFEVLALVGAIILLVYTIKNAGPQAWRTIMDMGGIMYMEFDKLKWKVEEFVKTFRENWDFLFGEKGGLRLVIDGFVNYLFGDKGTISTWIKGFFDAGANMVHGLWDGVLSAKDWIVTNLSDFWHGIIAQVNKILDMGSPSRVFYDIGANIMEGMYQGIRDNAYSPISAIGGVMSQITNVSNDNRTFVSMNANYENMQSPSSVYYDVRAALALARS
jgi:tape measure domain-containing protein